MTMVHEKRRTAKKIIASVLLLASFAMLFLPWMTVSVDFYGSRVTSASIDEITNGSLSVMAHQLAVGISDEAVDYGLTIDAHETEDALKLILDGKLSPIEAARYFQTLSHVSGTLYKIAYVGADTQLEMTFTAQLKTMSRLSLCVAIVIYVLLGALLISFGVAVYLVWTNKRYGTIPYLVCSFLLFAVFCAMTIYLESQLNSSTEQLGLLLGQETGDYEETVNTIAKLLAIEFGVSASAFSSTVNGLLNEISVYHFAPAGPISFLLATAVLAVPYITVTFGREETAESRRWKCVRCGHKNTKDAVCCIYCGALRPGMSRCAKCGKIFPGSGSYCRECSEGYAPTPPIFYPHPVSDGGHIKTPGEEPKKKGASFERPGDL